MATPIIPQCVSFVSERDQNKDMAAISATAMKTRDIVKAIMTQQKVMVENLKTTSWGSINKAERVPPASSSGTPSY
jgi:hypothetical protein